LGATVAVEAKRQAPGGRADTTPPPHPLQLRHLDVQAHPVNALEKLAGLGGPTNTSDLPFSSDAREAEINYSRSRIDDRGMRAIWSFVLRRGPARKRVGALQQISWQIP